MRRLRRSQQFCLFLLSFTCCSSVKVGDVVAICGRGAAELVDGSAGFPSVPSRRDHVAALPVEGDSLMVRVFDNETSMFHPVRCSLRIETCSNCVLNIQYTPPVKFLEDKDIRQMESCFESVLDSCFELKFVEERADTALDLIYMKTSLWDEPIRKEINSSGDSILLVLTLWNIDPNSTLNDYITNLFPFTIKSISNAEVITGTPGDIIMAGQSSVGFVQSPRYPSAYPRTITKKYTLVNTNPNGFVRLVFDDFHVHFQSELQIVDSDGTTLSNSKTEHRRPPAILSRGPNLTLHFRAHDFTHMVGFRARYDFVDDHDWPEKPSSRNCDEQLEGYGGEIRLDGAAHLTNTYVDCIWIIGRFPQMSRTFDRIYLKLESFQAKGVGLRLEVREGASSTADRLMLLFDAQTSDLLDHKQPRHGFSTSLASPAYYVRLRGFLMGTVGLEMVYSQFYRWATAHCPVAGEFHCDNARCIKATLRCDNIDHCGDGSDEQCQRPINQLKPPDADVSGLIALVIGVCGLIVLLLSTMAVMARVYRRRLAGQIAASQREVGSPSGYPNEHVPSMQTVGERRFYVLPENQISVIEAPPSYDDALKHPAVRTSRAGSYTNQAFNGSFTEERALSPDEPPPTLDEDEVSIPPRSSSPSTPARLSTTNSLRETPSNRDLEAGPPPPELITSYQQIVDDNTSASNPVTPQPAPKSLPNSARRESTPKPSPPASARDASPSQDPTPSSARTTGDIDSQEEKDDESWV